MRSGKHLTIVDRRVIKFFLNKGLKQYEIAKNIGVSESTISYELSYNRNVDGEYDSEYAQKQYEIRRKRSKKKVNLKRIQHYWIIQ